MKLNPLYMALGAILFVTPLAFAQSNDDQQGITQTSENNEIVFTANRTDQKLDTVGSTINVISEQQLENGQYQRVSDALATLPGVSMSSNSANGATSISLRGAGDGNYLVMIDGVIVNDPSNLSRGFNFSTLDTNNIERIEVLKGPQSTLYGSNAMAGVVQIFTKKGGPQRTTVTLEGGSYEHVKTTVQTQGQTDTLTYSLALGLNQEHGISSADKKLEGNTERDRFKNRDASFYINYAPLDWINFDLMARYDQQHTDLDNGGGPFQDNLEYYQKSKRWLGRFAINTILFDEKWLSSIIYDVTQSKLDDYNMPYTQNGHSMYKGTFESITWQNTLNFHENFQTLFGAEYSTERMRSESPYGDFPKQKTHQTSIYVDQHLNFGDRFFNTIGLRYDDHSEFGDKTTYRLTSRYNINEYIAVKGSYGTGFKAPTLYQLYAPIYGSETLQAETNKGYDFGFVITPTDHIEMNLTYFKLKFKNKVGFENNHYVNKGKVNTEGVEFSASATLTDQIKVGLDYTYTDAFDLNDHAKKRLSKLPKNIVGGFINYKPTENINLFAQARYHSSTTDTDFNSWPSKEVNLKPYWMINLAADYKINDDVSIYARVNNLLNKDYYTVWGYGQKRINGAIGVKISF